MVWPGRGLHHVDNGVDKGARGEVLAGAALGVAGVALEQPFVDFAP
jgi:hypothetical protein